MNYSVKPEEHELRQARQQVQKALEASRYVLEKEEDLEVNLGASSKEKYGAHGLAAGPGEIRLYFNPDVDNWSEDLRKTALSCYGEAWYRANIDSVTFVWQALLASITGLLLVEKIGEEKEPETEGLNEEWSELKDSLGDEVAVGSESFSWSLKLVLGRQLLEDQGLEELAGLSRSDVIEAAEKVFE